jgi:hypothetical protein
LRLPLFRRRCIDTTGGCVALAIAVWFVKFS